MAPHGPAPAGVLALAALAAGCGRLDEALATWRIERAARAATERLEAFPLPPVASADRPPPEADALRVLIRPGALRVDGAGARRLWRATGMAALDLPDPSAELPAPPAAGDFLIPSLHEALRSAAEPEAARGAPGLQPRIELWAEPAAPWGLLLRAAYNAAQAGFTGVAIAVSAPGGVRVIPIDPPSLCAGWDEAPAADPCAMPRVQVGRGGVTLGTVAQAVRRARPLAASPPGEPAPPDARRAALLAALLAPAEDCVLLTVAEGEPPPPAVPLALADLGAALDAVAGACPAQLLSAGDDVPWGTVAPVLTLLAGRGAVWLTAEPG